MPGTVLSASGAERSCCCSICCEVITVTELATLAAGVAIAVGLTTTGSLAAVGLVVVRGAELVDGVDGLGAGCRGVDGGGLTTIAGSSRSGDAVCCAAAGRGQSGSNMDVRAVDA